MIRTVAMGAQRKIGFAGFMAVFAAVLLALGAPAAAQNYSEGYEFLQAVKEREGAVATEMLRKPGTTVVNARDVSSGETGLHLVTRQRNVTWIRFLTQEGANPNIADKNGVTPLMMATQLGFNEGAEALVKAGAQVDVSNSTGETPLITAVHNRNVELIEIYLKAGADPDRTDNSGRSARAYAQAGRGDPRVLSALQEHETKGTDGAAAAEAYGPAF